MFYIYSNIKHIALCNLLNYTCFSSCCRCYVDYWSSEFERSSRSSSLKLVRNLTPIGLSSWSTFDSLLFLLKWSKHREGERRVVENGFQNRRWGVTDMYGADIISSIVSWVAPCFQQMLRVLWLVLRNSLQLWIVDTSSIEEMSENCHDHGFINDCLTPSLCNFCNLQIT